MKKLLFILISFVLLSIPSFAMSSALQTEVLNILVEFEANELQVEDKFESTELVYLNKWPAKIINEFNSYLNARNYETDQFLTRLSYTDPSGEYSVSGKIQRSLVVTTEEGEKAYIAYYLFIGGEWGREEVFHNYYVMDESGEVMLNGTFEREDDYWQYEEDWN